MPLADYGLGSI